MSISQAARRISLHQEAGVLLPLLASASENLSIFDPVSPPANSIRDLFLLILAITGVIFVLVEGFIIYCIFRFRSRPEASPSEPPQLYGSGPLELAWTVAPVLIVFTLFLIVVRTIAEVNQETPPPGAVKVRVVGHQWWWEYEYPELGVRTANELHVPVGEPVFLKLQSADVVHSYWVPRLAGKIDLIPGRDNSLWFQPQETGLFLGGCAEYCGTQHTNMLLRVVVQPQDEFQRWVEEQKKPAADVPAQRANRDLFLSLACVNCHRIHGTRAQGTFGPDLTHLMSRQTIGAGIVVNDPENLTTWVADPDRIKPGCWMPDMQLTEGQVKAVVDYLLSLN